MAKCGQRTGNLMELHPVGESRIVFTFQADILVSTGRAAASMPGGS
jgi:hypothetical protein